MYMYANISITSLTSCFDRDLYVALGEPIDQAQQAWAVRIYYKPGIGWLWIGSLLLGIGGFVAASDRRYRPKSSEQADAVA